MTLSSWKGTAMGRIREIEQAKHNGSAGSIHESLVKLKDDFDKSLAKYPRVQ